MCGIVGLVGLPDKRLVKGMCDEIMHRGPDSEGYYTDDNVSLGVRRLAIIDLVAGNQPIHNEDESVWTIFNGEIYNFRELRDKLEKTGHKFYTNSDTEVLIHLYEEKGEFMVDALRGMFAFAIYDKNNQKLLLARDRFGKKPIYYTWLNGRFAFSSELKSLLRLDIRRKINRIALLHYLTYFYNPLDESMIEGVYRLPPGSILTMDTRKKMGYSINEYWDVDYLPEMNLDVEDALEAFDTLLRDATPIRLISDVPLGISLSGGVDSSIITGVAKHFQENIKTFHIALEGAASELRYARKISEQFATDHKEYIIDSREWLLDLPKIVYYLDEPVADPSIIPSYYLYKTIRRDVTVCLTGEGGDELTWGYPWLGQDVLDSWFKLHNVVRSVTYSMIDKVTRFLPDSLRSMSRDINRYELLGYDKLGTKERCIARVSHYTPMELGNKTDTWLLYKNILGRNENKVDMHKRIAYLTIKRVLVNDFLFKDDRLSMANSLELRSPLLDHILAEYVFKLPSKIVLLNGLQKGFLKAYAIRKLHIPKEIILRKKGGFTIPLTSFHNELLGELDSNKSFLSDLVQSHLLRKALSSQRSKENTNRILALLVLAKWIELYQLNMSS